MFYGRTSKKLDIKTYFDTSIEHNTRTFIEHPLDDGCLQGSQGGLLDYNGARAATNACIKRRVIMQYNILAAYSTSYNNFVIPALGNKHIQEIW